MPSTEGCQTPEASVSNPSSHGIWGRNLNLSHFRGSHRFPGLPPPVSLWIRLNSTHAGGKKEQNRMLQVCYLISVKREVLFESMEGFIPAVQRQQSCWSNSVLGIVSISPVPTEGSVSSLRPPLRVGKMLLTRNLCNIYIWERQFLTLAGLS